MLYFLSSDLLASFVSSSHGMQFKQKHHSLPFKRLRRVLHPYLVTEMLCIITIQDPNLSKCFYQNTFFFKYFKTQKEKKYVQFLVKERIGM